MIHDQINSYQTSLQKIQKIVLELYPQLEPITVYPSIDDNGISIIIKTKNKEYTLKGQWLFASKINQEKIKKELKKQFFEQH